MATSYYKDGGVPLDSNAPIRRAVEEAVESAFYRLLRRRVAHLMDDYDTEIWGTISWYTRGIGTVVIRLNALWERDGDGALS